GIDPKIGTGPLKEPDYQGQHAPTKDHHHAPTLDLVGPEQFFGALVEAKFFFDYKCLVIGERRCNNIVPDQNDPKKDKGHGYRFAGNAPSDGVYPFKTSEDKEQ